MTGRIEEPAAAPFWPIVRRGLFGRCPRCGEGRLFATYLKPVAACSACGEPYGHIRADDGPAWLTILVVGHIIVTLILVTSDDNPWPAWLLSTVWVVVALALTLVLLPHAKGLFIALIWRAKSPGSEPD